MNRYYDELLDYLKTLPVIDSHEHLPGSEEKIDPHTDILHTYFGIYIDSDLISAGMSRKQYNDVWDTTQPLMARWDVLEPYWKLIGNTGYAKVLKLSARDIYGIERIDRDTIEALNKAFRAENKPGHFHRILKEMCNIEYSVLDNVMDHNSLDVDHTYYRSAYRPEAFLRPHSSEAMDTIEKYAGITVNTFDDLLAVCEVTIDKVMKTGTSVLKFGIATERPLLFEEAPKQAAEAYFNAVFRKEIPNEVVADVYGAQLKAYQDYIMHYIMKLANQHGLVVQFHTGLQYGNGNLISNSDPSKLSNLFMKYPNVRFDIFHLGYPYQNVMAVLGKMFPNVYLDMCWAHAISPAACVAALDDWLDSMPVNKIIAFGGDYNYVDGVYGHLLLAKMNVSETLARKVERGDYTMEEAKWVARRLFYENPKELFGE